MVRKAPDSKILDDIARVAGGAVNIMSGLQQQIHGDIKSRMDDMAARLNLVPREDLDRAEARIEKLEKAVAALTTKLDSGKKTTAKAKPAAKGKKR